MRHWTSSFPGDVLLLMLAMIHFILVGPRGRLDDIGLGDLVLAEALLLFLQQLLLAHKQNLNLLL